MKSYETVTVKVVNMEAEESTALGTVIRQRLVKTQQTEKS
jgi:hypothetical protein